MLLPNRLTDQALLHIVGVDGISLKFGSSEQRNNKDIVLAAVNNYGESLFYASIELRNCKEVVIAAVSNNGYAIEYVGEKLKNDSEILAIVNVKKRALNKERDESISDDVDFLFGLPF